MLPKRYRHLTLDTSRFLRAMPVAAMVRHSGSSGSNSHGDGGETDRHLVCQFSRDIFLISLFIIVIVYVLSVPNVMYFGPCLIVIAVIFLFLMLFDVNGNISRYCGCEDQERKQGDDVVNTEERKAQTIAPRPENGAGQGSSAQP